MRIEEMFLQGNMVIEQLAPRFKSQISSWDHVSSFDQTSLKLSKVEESLPKHTSKDEENKKNDKGENDEE